MSSFSGESAEWVYPRFSMGDRAERWDAVRVRANIRSRGAALAYDSARGLCALTADIAPGLRVANSGRSAAVSAGRSFEASVSAQEIGAALRCVHCGVDTLARVSIGRELWVRMAFADRSLCAGYRFRSGARGNDCEAFALRRGALSFGASFCPMRRYSAFASLSGSRAHLFGMLALHQRERGAPLLPSWRASASALLGDVRATAKAHSRSDGDSSASLKFALSRFALRFSARTSALGALQRCAAGRVLVPLPGLGYAALGLSTDGRSVGARCGLSIDCDISDATQ